MLSNAYFLAKFHFGTAVNEAAILQSFAPRVEGRGKPREVPQVLELAGDGHGRRAVRVEQPRPVHLAKKLDEEAVRRRKFRYSDGKYFQILNRLVKFY